MPDSYNSVIIQIHIKVNILYNAECQYRIYIIRIPHQYSALIILNYIFHTIRIIPAYIAAIFQYYSNNYDYFRICRIISNYPYYLFRIILFIYCQACSLKPNTNTIVPIYLYCVLFVYILIYSRLCRISITELYYYRILISNMHPNHILYL